MQAVAEALVMTDCLPGLMLKRTDRHDEDATTSWRPAKLLGTSDYLMSRQRQPHGAGQLYTATMGIEH